MADISRRFKFEGFDIGKAPREKRKEIKKKLIDYLNKKGYSVLESNEFFGGISTNFLVKGPSELLTKDFCEYTKELGLIFKPEEWYLEYEKN